MRIAVGPLDGARKFVSRLRRSEIFYAITQPFRAGLSCAAPTGLDFLFDVPLARKRALRLLRNKLGQIGCVAAAFAICALPAMAQETGDATTTTTGWVFRWLNFAIIFVGIIWAFSKAGPYFRRHSEEISQKIAEGTRAREAAEKQRREVQEKLARVDEEVAKMRADAKRAAEGEAQRLRALAKEEAQNIERAGQAEIAAAEHAAKLELKSYAGELAVDRAEVLLRERMTASTEAAVFEAFVESLEERRN